MVERRVVYRMLEESGWIRDRVEEETRGEQRIYIRTGTGDRDLGEGVREVGQLLEPELMVDDRIRLIQRQLWTYFERQNPGPSALLPGMDREIA
jgi:DNA-binding PadR family transcriptional regulator